MVSLKIINGLFEKLHCMSCSHTQQNQDTEKFKYFFFVHIPIQCLSPVFPPPPPPGCFVDLARLATPVLHGLISAINDNKWHAIYQITNI